MFDEKDVRELAAFQGEESPVLSLYLSTDPSRHMKDEARLELRAMLKQAAELGASPADIERVERFVDFEHDWQSKGVAMFSCQGHDFWRAFSLTVPVKNHAFVADRPYIKPLSDILDEYGGYAVLLVDQEGARLLAFRLGLVEDTAGVMGEELKRHKQGGWAAERLQRHEDGKAKQNLKEVAKATREFCKHNDCERLVVGGTDENVSKLLGLLPKALQSRVVATMPIDITASESEILERSQDAIEQAQREQEAELVRQTITAAVKGGMGAIGLADTLTALQEGRVHKLLIAEDFQASAYQCEHCGYITAEKADKCAYCGGKMVKIEDAGDAIVRRAIERGVDVEFVPENDDLKQAGSVAAVLRY